MLLAGVTPKQVRIAVSNLQKGGNTDEQNSYRSLDLFHHLLVRLARVAKQALVMGIGAAGPATLPTVSGLVVEADANLPEKGSSGMRHQMSDKCKRNGPCSEHGPKSLHADSECWVLHPELKPGNVRLRRRNKKRNVDNAAAAPSACDDYGDFDFMDGMHSHGLMLSGTEVNPFEFLESQLAETAIALPNTALPPAESDSAAPSSPAPDCVPSGTVAVSASEDVVNTRAPLAPVPFTDLPFQVVANVFFVHEDFFCTFQMPSDVPLARLHMWALAALGEIHPASVDCNLFYLQPQPVDLRDTPAFLLWPRKDVATMTLEARTFSRDPTGAACAEQPPRGPGGFLPLLPGPRIPLLDFAPEYSNSAFVDPTGDDDGNRPPPLVDEGSDSEYDEPSEYNNDEDDSTEHDPSPVAPCALSTGVFRPSHSSTISVEAQSKPLATFGDPWYDDGDDADSCPGFRSSSHHFPILQNPSTAFWCRTVLSNGVPSTELFCRTYSMKYIL